MNYAEFVNTMADVLCGYCGASELEILERAKELVEQERIRRLGAGHKALSEAVRNLQDVIDDIETGAYDTTQENRDET